MSDLGVPRLPYRAYKDDPKMIGPWKIGRTLGCGTSGRVKLARHARTGEMAAIKMIPKSVLFSQDLSTASEEAEQTALALQREIVIMKLINHPNVMRLHDVWEASNDIYLVLEYVQGGELFDYMVGRPRLPVAEALTYFQQIIHAVDYCHRFNIAHRDLKPENILLDSDQNVKIADFGLAAWQSGNMLRTSCGSPHYAAPEVVTGLAYDGSAADVWSCGIILHALLVGRLPFDDDERYGVLEKIKIGVWDMPRDIPILAQDLLRRMLTKDVKRRINMTGIKKHSFFLSHNPKPVDNAHILPSLEDIARPILSRDHIDAEIFKSLQTLWRGTSDDVLIESLTNNKRNWQKGVYHLLAEYKKKSLEDYDAEAEIRKCAKLHRKKTRANHTASRKVDPPPVRVDPPTPRRASGRRYSSSSSQQSSSLSPEPAAFSPLVEFQNLLPLDIPEHTDTPLQTFFQQITDHITVLHSRTGASPNLSSPPGQPIHDSFPTRNDTKPLQVRRRGTRNADLSNKENVDDGFLIVDVESAHLNKSSVKKSDKKVQIVEPQSSRRTSKLRKKRSKDSRSSLLNSPTSPLPSSPIGTWLHSVFKFGPATYEFSSPHDLATTKAECRRLLMEMNALVMLDDDEGLGVLKCKLDGMRFRVEIQESAAEGYSLVMLLEKGSLETFKEVHNRLQHNYGTTITCN